MTSTAHHTGTAEKNDRFMLVLFLVICVVFVALTVRQHLQHPKTHVQSPHALTRSATETGSR